MRTVDLLIGQRVWPDVKVRFGSLIDRDTLDMRAIYGDLGSCEDSCRFKSSAVIARRLEIDHPDNPTGRVVWRQEIVPTPLAPTQIPASPGSEGGRRRSPTAQETANKPIRSSRRRLDFELAGDLAGDTPGLPGPMSATRSPPPQAPAPARRGRKRAACA